MSETDRILVVEDDVDLQDLLRFTFEGAGYDVDTANDGAEALEFLEEEREPPELILLDLRMPDVDGMEFLRRRDETGAGDVPVVVLTAVDSEDALEEAFELGADDYVTKPFRPRALRARVERLL